MVYPFQKMSEPVSVLLCEVPAEVHFVLRDGHFNTLELHEACEHADRLLMTTKHGSSPQTAMGSTYDVSSTSSVLGIGK